MYSNLMLTIFRTTSSDAQPNSKNKWWKVDLGTEHYINLVVVYSRTDACCAKWIDKAEVRDIIL